MVNKSGLNFEDRQSLCLENQHNMFKQHELQQEHGRDTKEDHELKFKPELNEKSRSLVENKKIPRNGPGYSRANYYFYIKQQQQNEQKDVAKSENKKILQNPNLQKYLAMDVVERLLDNETQKEILYGGRSRNQQNVDGDDVEPNAENAQNAGDRRLSEIELEDFIERQKQYEMFRKRRIQKLWKRFNDDDKDKESESDMDFASPSKTNQNMDALLEIEEAPKPSGSEKPNQFELSYTQLFNVKKQEKTENAKNVSYSSLSKMSKMHCETQFVSM